MATSSKANISKTENFFWIFHYVPEIYVKFGVFSKKDQVPTSSNADISETKNFLRIIYCVSEIYLKFEVFWKKRSVS